MAEIGFIPLPSAGHLFPTFKLAKSLQARGHSVTYYLGASSGKPVIAQGLSCLTVLEDLIQRACSLTSADASEYFVEANKFLLRNRGEILRLFMICRPNVLLVD